jgi:hypothetical protein
VATLDNLYCGHSLWLEDKKMNKWIEQNTLFFLKRIEEETQLLKP